MATLEAKKGISEEQQQELDEVFEDEEPEAPLAPPGNDNTRRTGN